MSFPFPFCFIFMQSSGETVSSGNTEFYPSIFAQHFATAAFDWRSIKIFSSLICIQVGNG